MAYYVASSLIAILTGLFLVNIIKPGVGAELGLTADVSTSDITACGLSDILYRIVPNNLISSMANGEFVQFSMNFIHWICLHARQTNKGEST